MVMHAGVSYSQGDLSQQGTAECGMAVLKAVAQHSLQPQYLQMLQLQKRIDRSRLGLEGAVAYGHLKCKRSGCNINNDFRTTNRKL